MPLLLRNNCCIQRGFTCYSSASPQQGRTDASRTGDLKLWQLDRLETAFHAGRRNVKIQQLCKEVQMSRLDVITWLKKAESMPESLRESVFGARRAAAEGLEGKATLPRQKPGVDRQGTASPSASAADAEFGEESGIKTYQSKRIPNLTLATLEKVFSTCHWPSDDTLKSLWKLHRLPRQKAIDWFAERRRQETAAREDCLKSRPRP